jgi:hypothetical protein
LTGDPDGEGGGHKFGVGRPGKTEFPESWSDDKIIEEAISVGNDPASSRRVDPDGRVVVEGTREGIDIRVVLEPDGITVVTAYPTNTPRNPRIKKK